MEKHSKIIPALIALGLTLLSVSLVIAAWLISQNELPPPMGVSRSSHLWMYSFFIAIVSLFFYYIDLSIALDITLTGMERLLRNALNIAIGFGGPMLFICSTFGGIILIWNLYYLVMFTMEAIYVIIHFKKNRQSPTHIQNQENSSLIE